MLANRYIYISNTLKLRYVEGAISYEVYMSSLETTKEEELKKVYDFEKSNRLQEIYDFELRQLASANQAINQREIDKVNAETRRIENEERKKKLDEEQSRIRSLTPEEKLYEERERFYKEEVPRLIEEYKRESKKYKDIHDKLQWMIIIGSAFVTSMTGITIFTNLSIVSYTLKIAAAVFSLVVTIVAGFVGYFKYRERSVNLQKAADDIEYEYDAIKLGTHHYSEKTREKAMGVFADRIMKRIKEQKEQQQTLEQPSETTLSQTKSKIT